MLFLHILSDKIFSSLLFLCEIYMLTVAPQMQVRVVFVYFIYGFFYVLQHASGHFMTLSSASQLPVNIFIKSSCVDVKYKQNTLDMETSPFSF